MAAAQNGDSVVLEEEIDPNYTPTIDEQIDYGKWLGMSFPEDDDLLWIAREGLKAPLPEHWKPCRTLDTGEIYYFSFADGQSSWDHPCDSFYRNLYEEEKKRRNLSKQNGLSQDSSKRHESESDDVRRIIDMQKREGAIDTSVQNKLGKTRGKTPHDLNAHRPGHSNDMGMGSGAALNKKAVLPKIKRSPLETNMPSSRSDVESNDEQSEKSSPRAGSSLLGSAHSDLSDQRMKRTSVASERGSQLTEDRRRKGRRGDSVIVDDGNNYSNMNRRRANGHGFEANSHVSSGEEDDEDDEDEDGEKDEVMGNGHGHGRDYNMGYGRDYRSSKEPAYMPMQNRGEQKQEHVNGGLSNIHAENERKLQEAQDVFDQSLENLRLRLADEKVIQEEEHEQHIQQLQDDFSKFQRQIKRAQDDAHQKHDEELAQLQDELEKFNQQYLDKKEELQENHKNLMQEQEEELSRIQQKFNQKKNTLDQLRRDVEALEEQYDRLTDIGDLQQQLQEITDKEESSQQLLRKEREHRERMVAQIDDFEREKSELIASFERERLQIEEDYRIQLEAQAKQLDEKGISGEGSNSLTPSQLSRDPNDVAELASKQELIAELQSQLQDVRQALEASRLESKDISHTLANERLKFENLESSHQTQVREIRQIQANCEEWEEKYNKAVASLLAFQEDQTQSGKILDDEVTKAGRQTEAALERARIAEEQHSSQALAHRTERERLQECLSKAQTDAKALESRVEALELTLSETETEARQSNTEKRKLQSSLDTAHEKCANVENRCKTLESLLEASRSENDQNEVSQNALGKLEMELNEARTDLMNERSKARSEQNALEENIEDLKAELQKARDREISLDAETKKKVFDLQEKLTTAETLSATLNQEICVLEERNAASLAEVQQGVDAESRKLENALEDAEAAREQAEAAREQAEAAREQAEAAREQAETARQQAEASCKQAEVAREQAENDLKELEQDLENTTTMLNQEIESLRVQLLSAAHTTSGEKGDQENRLARVLQDLHEANMQLESTEARHAEDLENWRQEQARLREDLSNRDEDLAVQLRTALREATELREERGSLKRNLESTREDVANHKAKVESLRAELHGALEDARALRDERDQLRQETERLRRESAQAEHDSSQQHELSSMQRSLYALQAQQRKLEAERKQAQENEEVAIQDAESISQELARTNKQLLEEQRRAATLERAQRQFSNREAFLNSRVSDLEIELEDLHNKADTQEEKVRKLSDRCNKLEKERSIVITERDRLLEQNKELEDSLSALSMTKSTSSDMERRQRKLDVERQQLDEERRAMDKEKRKIDERAKAVKQQLLRIEERIRREGKFNSENDMSEVNAASFSRMGGRISTPNKEEVLASATYWNDGAEEERKAFDAARDILHTQHRELEDQRTRLGKQQDTWRETEGRSSFAISKVGSILELQEDELTETLRELSQKLEWLQTVSELHEKVSKSAMALLEHPSDSDLRANFLQNLDEYRAEQFFVEDQDRGDEGNLYGVADENESLFGNSNQHDRYASFGPSHRMNNNSRLGGAAMNVPPPPVPPGPASYAYPVYPAHTMPLQPMFMPARHPTGSTVVFVNENGQILQESTIQPVMHVPRSRAFRGSGNNHVENGYNRMEAMQGYGLGPETRAPSPVPSAPLHEVSMLPEEVRLMESRWNEQQAFAQEHSQWLMNFRRDLERVSSVPSVVSASSSSSRRGTLKSEHRRSRIVPPKRARQRTRRDLPRTYIPDFETKI